MKKPTKSIITSSLLALAFGAMSVGTTFALFTSKAETTINVESGLIDLKAPISVVNAWELGNVSMTGSEFSYQNSIGGSISKDENNIVHLNKLAPGDGAIFALTPNNSGTNIKTKARLVVTLEGELAGALNIEVTAGEDMVIGFKGAHTGYTPWEEVEVGENPTAFNVKVEFPDGDNGEILFGEANHDNQYQNKTATLVIGYEAVQGNAQTDDMLLIINNRLMTKAYQGSANKTMYDALQDLSESQVAAIQERGYVWSVEEDQFYNFTVAPTAPYKFFKMYDAMPTSQDYSIYAYGNNWTGATINPLTVGFDAGETIAITSITYDRHLAEEGQEVTIRTNTAQTSLTINAPLDTIHHYDALGALNIIEAATASYHEFGSIAYAEIAKGRIVLEKGADVDHIHVNKKDSVEEFDTVIIKDNGAETLPNAITRDQVDVSEAKPVVTVESGSTSETVYVYPYTDAQETKTGTTEKTDSQNTSVESALGQLVLDNGSDAGEKAMSNNQKEEAKTDAVEVAQNEEAENAGYEITHHEAKAPTCTEVGYYAYDSYEVNGVVVKIGYNEIPATGHIKAENPVYQHNFNGQWQHATQCSVCGAWIVEYCIDDNHDNECDVCGHQMYIEVSSTADLYTDRGFGISNNYYKLMNDVALTKPQYGNVYLNSNVVIDLNGFTLSNYPLNSPTDAQFRSYGTANSTFVFTLKDSSEAKTGQFMSRFGDHFLYGGQNNGNNRLIINCEDGVTINTCYDYQGNEMNSFASGGGYFINEAGKDIIVRNAHLVIGGIAHVNSGYTVTFENCVIESRQSSGFLQSGSGNIVYKGCTITTVMQSSSGNVLDSSSYPSVTFVNGTTVNGVAK